MISRIAVACAFGFGFCALGGGSWRRISPIPTVADTSAQKPHPNTTAGEFTPARGFDIYKGSWASLNISFYGLFRYVNHLPGDQTFVDHLNREREVDTRHDLNWHRTMIWLTGFLYTPKMRYNITSWSLGSTQQTLLFGNLQYRFGKALTLGVGILPNLTARSMQGSWPFWAGSDRTMAEDFFRGGFSSGAFITGQPISRLYYSASVNTNLSQLGTTAANDTRDMAVSGSLLWLPTTGEFGPRGGFGDLEHHEELATQFGISLGHSRESRYAADTAPPNATQIKLSDGVNPFDAGALANGVTVQSLNYDLFAARCRPQVPRLLVSGRILHPEVLRLPGGRPVPNSSITDTGFLAQAMYMVVPKTLGLYVSSGFVFDDFDRKPYEIGGGASYYPSGTRTWRLNLHVMYLDKSPASSTFGYYTAGLTGTMLSFGVDILM